MLVVWVVSLLALARSHAGPDRAHAQAIVVDGEGGLHEGDEWQSVYLQGERIGWVHLHKRRAEAGWRIRYELELDLQVMQSRQRVRTELSAGLDDELEVRDFDFTLDGGPGGRLTVRGTVSGRTVELTLGTGGEQTTRTLELPERPRLSATNRALLAARGLAVGKEFSLSYFDPASLSQREMHVRVVGEDKLHVMGRSVEAFVLEQHVEGVKLRAWVTPAGDVLKEELPLGLVAIRETEEEARFGTGAKVGTDLLSLTAPRLVGALPDDAGGVTRAVFELDMLPEGDFVLDGGRQRLEGRRLTVVREALPPAVAGAAADLPPEARAALAPELLVQSDHPAIRRQAEVVVGEATAPAERVRLLADWVFRSVEKANVVGIPSALETLRARRGDCNEHSTLFVALARSLGVPARIDVGMVHKGGRFYYHAWPEVWLVDRWVTVDPTWGQLPADVTHLRFVRGGLDRQLEMFKVIGQLRSVRLVERAP